MVKLTAFYSHDHGKDGISLSTPADVDALVDQVRADSLAHWPVLIQAYVDGDDDTPEFCVGVDGDRGVLTYSGRQWVGGIWHSVGDMSSEGESLYYYMDNDTEIPDAARISLDAIRSAFKEFLATGGNRPESVEWHQYV
jgi:hypothetical protein